MAKKKQPWEMMNKTQQQKAAREAAEKAKEQQPATGGQGGEKRKMVRIGEDEHAMLKKAAAWLEMGMQEYLEMLVRNSYEALFPDDRK